MDTLRAAYESYVMPTYGRYDLDIVRGSGSVVEDSSGRKYLDFGGGIAVCSLGHAHPEVTRAVSEQAATLVHTSNLYRTGPQAKLAERLVEITGPGKVFFCNSGAEANEGLIKLSRKFGSVSGRHEMVTFQNSFHGRTMACISATGQGKVKEGFAPLLEGFRHLPFGDLEKVREAIEPETVAILVEPVQGEGGIHLAGGDFLLGLRKICDECGMLLFFDEVQCGLGRTGELCGWKALAPEIQPDGVSWAKGIANGFPLGAFWISDKSMDDRGPLCNLLGPGSHGTTYGGNPVCCAAGLAVLDVIERDGLLAHTRAMGGRLAAALRAGGVGVRGVGLMLGVLMPDGVTARDFVLRLHERGLLAVVAGDSVVRLLPPLNVTPEEIDRAVSIVLDVFASLR
ncbi:MAG: acetylornithine transaminase [Terrimicrobiaceae bacterium]